MFQYKFCGENYNATLRRIIFSYEKENTEGSQKSLMDIDNDLVSCFMNISISYKSGNMFRLSNQLSKLNDITVNNYFEPCQEFFINNIPDILMQVSFDKTNKFPAKSKKYALSVIENLTFEEQYGFFHFFYDLGIINSICINLFSENLDVILSSIRILLNYSESQENYANDILMTCTLEQFIKFIISLNGDGKVEKRIRYYTVLLLCELSFKGSSKYINCFYISVDCLLHYSPLYQELYNVEKYIFWIVINCIKSDQMYIERFINNECLINLIMNVINNAINDFTQFLSALIVLAELYQNPYFIIQDLNLFNLIKSISLYNPDEFFIIPILCIIKKHITFHNNIQLIYDQNFVSTMSQMFDNSNFSIKFHIIELFCLLIDNSSIRFLPYLINEHVIQKIFEIYVSNETNFRNNLLISLINILNSVNNFNEQTCSLVLSEISEVDFSIFDECNKEQDNDDQDYELINHFIELYEKCNRLQIKRNI